MRRKDQALNETAGTASADQLSLIIVHQCDAIRWSADAMRSLGERTARWRAAARRRAGGGPLATSFHTLQISPRHVLTPILSLWYPWNQAITNNSIIGNFLLGNIEKPVKYRSEVTFRLFDYFFKRDSYTLL